MILFANTTLLMLILLNPFLLVLYLLDLIEILDHCSFRKVLLRAGLISFAVFVIFTALGDAVFTAFLQARFASFQIFGGIVFLLIGVRFVFSGTRAFHGLRGDPQHLAGSIAMPIMIGPGTLSASIVAGQRLGIAWGSLAVLMAVVISLGVIIALKLVHDYVKPRHEGLIERYVEIVGRVAALVIGTFSIEMIMRGLKTWLAADFF
ncbi:MAG: MarC family protein [Chitinivibrionales bacterium]|nr:MarC family protein [Chitinivibrionales bacterium]MBD3358812.1 MarC family protein [Chitinivibrionales bacterium]